VISDHIENTCGFSNDVCEMLHSHTVNYCVPNVADYRFHKSHQFMFSETALVVLELEMYSFNMVSGLQVNNCHMSFKIVLLLRRMVTMSALVICNIFMHISQMCCQRCICHRSKATLVTNLISDHVKDIFYVGF
jgi:hypothetical protein